MIHEGAVMMEQPMAMAQWVYHLQSTGRYSFTRSQVESDTGRSFFGSAERTSAVEAAKNHRFSPPRVLRHSPSGVQVCWIATGKLVHR